MKSPKIKESPQARVKRAAEITRRLHKLYPEADCALEHDSAVKLLIATILSAQCTDERVNRVTPALFARYPSVRDLAAANQTDVEAIIRSTGFFRNKAKNILGAARVICERFNGNVPEKMEELLQLPGVARKTANVILGTWFKQNVGVVVDTHIGRLSHRLGLSWRSRDDKDAVKIEQDLMEVLPREEWTFVGHALIWHGRRVCPARKPVCDQCTLSDVCPSAFSFEKSAPAESASPRAARSKKSGAVAKSSGPGAKRKPSKAHTSGKASGKRARR